jgi:hypothetical protein
MINSPTSSKGRSSNCFSSASEAWAASRLTVDRDTPTRIGHLRNHALIAASGDTIQQNLEHPFSGSRVLLQGLVDRNWYFRRRLFDGTYQPELMALHAHHPCEVSSDALDDEIFCSFCQEDSVPGSEFL